MANKPQEIIYLKDYKAPEFIIDEVNLDVDLYENYATVISTLQCRRNPGVPQINSYLRLHGNKLMLKGIKLNDQSLSNEAYIVDESGLTIRQLPDSFTLEITTQIEPHNNTELVGLYKTKTMFCTQCEAEGFRRITYYLDRPDVMAKFITTIRADRALYPVLLSNGNLIAREELANGRHLAVWEDPFKKPSYLFALVAGNLVAAEDHFLTRSGKSVVIKIYVAEEDLDKTTHALQAVKKAMLWDEQKYGREYDLNVFMVVAINDFNMGAMENKGLNIFNSKYILASPQTATDRDFKGIDQVIGHEYFHNWSGNRVTCRDWFQLSLKEGFTVFREQQFVEDITKTSISRIEQVKLLLTRQFIEDSSPLAHSVRPVAYEEIDNFYTTTVYEKGAEIIRMLWILLGSQVFRKATDLYFSRHDGQAATIENFIQAMQDASGLDLSQFMLWYEQAGTPKVTVTQQYDAKYQQYQLTLQQHCPTTPGQPNKKPMHIPIAVGLLDQSGKSIPLQFANEATIQKDTNIISLTAALQKFTFVNVTSKPVLSILRNFSAPVIIETEQPIEELVFLTKHDSDPFNRWDAFRRLKKQCILQLIALAKEKQTLVLNPVLLDTYKSVIADQHGDLALQAELLLLPTSEEMLKYMDVADPDLIYHIKCFLKTTLAKTFAVELRALYETCVTKHYSYKVIEVAKRKLKNICLDYLLWLNDAEMFKLGEQQFNDADNMTDLIGVLTSITHINCAERARLFQIFYQNWQHAPLIMDKWLALQAISELPNSTEQVATLLKHKIFVIHNPNKVYALIGSFGNNSIRFHDNSGKGYQLLADVLLQLDKFNPQVAARMASPFAQWRCYDQPRQLLMQQQLTNIIRIPNISKNLSEIVNKCLQK